ncbi:histidine kinase-like ATPase, partial [Circinella umbellata]
QTIQPLDKSTVRKLHSGQVIIDIESIVKELIENALDAHAHSIDVKLVDNGLNLIQVMDDGHGID